MVRRSDGTPKTQAVAADATARVATKKKNDEEDEVSSSSKSIVVEGVVDPRLRRLQHSIRNIDPEAIEEVPSELQRVKRDVSEMMDVLYIIHSNVFLLSSSTTRTTTTTMMHPPPHDSSTEGNSNRKNGENLTKTKAKSNNRTKKDVSKLQSQIQNMKDQHQSEMNIMKREISELRELLNASNWNRTTTRKEDTSETLSEQQ